MSDTTKVLYGFVKGPKHAMVAAGNARAMVRCDGPEPGRASPSMVGQRVGAYELQGILGEGGMSTVYRAVHTRTGRNVAIKMIRPRYAGNLEMVTRFLREAEVTSRIDHRGIVAVLDSGYHDNRSPYLTMELLEGESLEQCIDRDGRISHHRALLLARHIASALGAAHQHGVVHRDLKPGNIMLTWDATEPFGERAKVVDFGIAKLVGSHFFHHCPSPQLFDLPLTKKGKVLGTVSYMAPEQCQAAAPIDHRADLYALGCVLFHMLCGRQPFIGPAPWVMVQQRDRLPPRPRELNPSIPAATEALILRLMAKNPAERPQSAAALIAELDALIPEEPAPGSASQMAGLPAARPASCPPPRPWLLPLVLAIWTLLMTGAYVAT